MIATNDHCTITIATNHSEPRITTITKLPCIPSSSFGEWDCVFVLYAKDFTTAIIEYSFFGVFFVHVSSSHVRTHRSAYPTYETYLYDNDYVANRVLSVYILSMENLIMKARLAAKEAHDGQIRKYSGLPYFTHVEEVANIIESINGSNDMVAAAYLHDIVEDTDWTHDRVREEFNATVAEYVYYLTNISIDSKEVRRIRKAMDRSHLKKAPIPAKTIKLADLKSNLRDIVDNDPKFAAVYFKEKIKMMGVLTEGNPQLYQDVLKIITDGWTIVR